MSPLDISIMLHYHYSPEDWPRSSPSGDESIERFVELGMLEHCNAQHQARYRITPKGTAYVQILMRIPPPEIRNVWSVELAGNQCRIEL